MVKELVNSILEAERQAQHIVAQAKDDAREILAQATNKADEMVAAAGLALKEDVVKWNAQANQDAALSAQQLLTEGKQQADKQLAASNALVAKAVKLVTEELL